MSEASAVLRRMALNDYTQNMETRYSGAYGELAESVNLVRTRIQHVTDTFQNIARGNLEELSEYKAIGQRSEKDQLVPSMIQVMENIQALLTDANQLSRAGVEGKLSTRADVTRHNGDYRKVIEGVNGILDAVIKPVQEAARVLQQVAEGDLLSRVQGEYQGDHAAIKEAINRMGDQLSTSMRAIGRTPTPWPVRPRNSRLSATR